ncbi:hypothetical protein F2P81_001139 [Scophthalmus maximus]|uniref:Uncharacterized protein n=1 Tax=Scophthalmus maximus TaxID=52904 RepID=A0A6A4TJ02_SCOMX|nr:hypothetical protein F2P81_001139 [Scophthalmus maximus]
MQNGCNLSDSKCNNKPILFGDMSHVLHTECERLPSGRRVRVPHCSEDTAVKELRDKNMKCFVNQQLSDSTQGKEIWDSDGINKLMEYFQGADKRFLQHSREETRNANITLLDKMDEDNTALFGLVGRMVAVMEAQSK